MTAILRNIANIPIFLVIVLWYHLETKFSFTLIDRQGLAT